MADMESLLLGDSDSEEDTNPAPAPVVVPAPSVDTDMSKADLSARLKSLYSPANNAPRPSGQTPPSLSQSNNILPPTAQASIAVSAPRLPAPLPPRQQMPSSLVQTVPAAASRPPDPFEPTPLTTMIQRQPSTPMLQPMQQLPPSLAPQQHLAPPASLPVQQQQRTMPPQQQQQQLYAQQQQQQQQQFPQQQQQYEPQGQAYTQQQHRVPQQQQRITTPQVQQQAPQQQRTLPPQQQHVQQQQQHQRTIPQEQMQQQSIQQQQRTMPAPQQSVPQQQQQQQQFAPQQQRQPTMQNPATQLPPPLQSNRPPSSNSSTSTVRTSNITAVAATSAQNRAKLEREAKQRKEKFLMFTRVLMKYLEQKDPTMHARAKSVIRECAEKNKAKEVGYESVTASMQARLRSTVGEAYWKRAETYLNHFLKQKEVELAKRKKAAGVVGGVVPAVGAPQQLMQQGQLQQQQQQPPPRPSPQLQQQQQQQQQQSQMQQHLQQQQLNLVPASVPSRDTRQQIEDVDKKNESAKNAAIAHKKREEQKRAMQKQQAIKQQQNVQKQKQQAAQKLAQIQRENAAQMQVLKQSNPAVASKQKATVVSKVEAAKKIPSPSLSRKSSASASAVAVSGRMSPTAVDTQPPREYAEYMDSLDHMVDYDWTTTGLLLSSKNDIDLQDEQRILIYGGGGIAPKPTFAPASRGWSQRNVVNARMAWARIRLPEQKEERRAIAVGNAPIVQGMSLPSKPNTQVKQQQPSVLWFNEDATETDLACATLSEATEVYLKGLLEKALICARQRENIQGVRLWHLQHGATKPPLSLRLGCEVPRQVAQSMGNAAKTVQRMEEAIARSSKQSQCNNQDAWSEASSMADLAMGAPVASAVEKADYHAKRSFEIYGGKESGGPPFRVPKMAKLMTKDFKLGLELCTFAHQNSGVAASAFL